KPKLSQKCSQTNKKRCKKLQRKKRGKKEKASRLDPCSHSRPPVFVDSLLDFFLLPRHVINQQIFAKMIRSGIECPAAIHLRHLVNKRTQARAVVEHERINGNPALRCALHLA